MNNFLEELTILMNEFHLESMIQAAEEVIHNHNSFDYHFVLFCQEFLDQSANEQDSASRHETD